MTNQISAKIVADSINQKGDRITTMEVVFPRFILAEFNTHRLFSRNSASSRAIPFLKMLRSVKESLFTPIAFQKDHKGMQGTHYFEGWRDKVCRIAWKAASKMAIAAASRLYKIGVTKQLANRLLEPFMYHKVLITATEFDNFFNLRCPQYVDEAGKIFKSKKDFCTLSLDPTQGWMENFESLEWFKINEGQGEIHIMDLAEKMWDVLNESTPKLLQSGKWHIPYSQGLEQDADFYEFFMKNTEHNQWANADHHDEALDDMMCKIAIARCARLSYQTLGDNPKIDYEADLNLFQTLLSSGHFSPFEHVATSMSDLEYEFFIKGMVSEYGHDETGKVMNFKENSKGWCNNFRGFIQYRALLENL